MEKAGLGIMRRVGTNHSPGSSRTAKELFCRVAEPEETMLTIDKARELAWALLTMADAVEFVSTPVTEILSALNYPGG